MSASFPSRGLLLAFLSLAASAIGAQDSASAQDAVEAPSTAAAAPAAAPAPTISVEQAYRREYAFLEAQKRELEDRLASVRQQLTRDQTRLESEVAALENAALAARAEAEAMNDELLRAQQTEAANLENAEFLDATLEQARATLGGFGDNSLEAEGFAARSDTEKLQTLFGNATRLLTELGTVRRKDGTFFLADGSEASGQIVRYGNIAVFGISPQGSGALAPAGGGRFRLWNAPAAETAEALARGDSPGTLSAYLFENANVAVTDPEQKTFWSEMQKGGLIGYFILLLGALAAVMVVLRALFLQRAGASIHAINAAVEPQIRAGRIDDAIAAAKKFKGSAARVVTAALRNLDRDREHVEDIVSESILHESSHLNRFGAFIVLIAAVAANSGGIVYCDHKLVFYRYHRANITDVLCERTVVREPGYRWKELHEFRERVEHLAMLPGNSQAFLERLRDLWTAREQQWVSLALACFLYRHRKRIYALRWSKRPALRHILRYTPGLRFKRLTNPFAYAPPP